MILVYQLPFSLSQGGPTLLRDLLKFISVLILFLDGLVSTILLKHICYEFIAAM